MKHLSYWIYTRSTPSSELPYLLVLVAGNIRAKALYLVRVQFFAPPYILIFWIFFKLNCGKSIITTRFSSEDNYHLQYASQLTYYSYLHCFWNICVNVCLTATYSFPSGSSLMMSFQHNGLHILSNYFISLKCMCLFRSVKNLVAKFR